ncbi:phosphonoacetate hydrolase [Paraburkholderia sp. RAU2J]|nr:phosphonoacetate hydrolase [Paraburkholderia sp. RAU2J]
MAGSGERTIEVNGRSYRLPLQATVVVRVDGCESDYLDSAVAAGVAPFIGKMLAGGAAFKGDCVIPSFTNRNNLSIVCGVPPSVHGLRTAWAMSSWPARDTSCSARGARNMTCPD